METLFTFCPPGPEEREKLSLNSQSAMEMVSVIHSMGRLSLAGSKGSRGWGQGPLAGSDRRIPREGHVTIRGLDAPRALSYQLRMKMTLDFEAFSFRQDKSVPDLAFGNTFTVMDARCSLCARGARWIARNDRAHVFTIIPVQSVAGEALMVHYGLDPADPLSWLYVEDGLAYTSLDALIRVGWRLGGVWKGLSLLRILPVPAQNILYRAVARNRYRLFGTADLCSMPDPEVQKRLLG